MAVYKVYLQTAALLAAFGAALTLHDAASAATKLVTAPAPAASAASSSAGTALERYTLRDLSAQQPLEFRGVDHSMYLPLSVRLDQTVVSAKLKLNYTFSPALLPDLSMLKVMVNNEALSTVVQTKAQLGTPQNVEVSLDPRFFTEFSRLRLQFIGHYTLDCEFPFHTSLWANVSNDSTLELVTKPLALSNDLGLLPAPFFDARDSRELVLPFMLAAKPSLATVRSAAVLASWFGALADYRGAKFPVLQDGLPTRHTVVFATNDERPQIPGLTLAQVNVPTLTFAAHPQNPAVKLLLVQGKDADQLKQAVDALVLGQAVLTGDRAEVQSLKYPEPRAAYDAPAMVKAGKIVKFGELTPDRNSLQVRGSVLDRIRLDMRMPSDVFTWQSKGVPMDLHFRYTPPRDYGLASLAIRANDQLVQSLLLQPAESASRLDKLTTPFTDANQAVAKLTVNVPAFDLASRNRLEFQFDIPPTDEGRCRTTLQTGANASVDPDSTLDLRDLEHYATLPNLAFYASSGFPFTKYADLAETALVLPDAPSAPEIEAALGAVGHLGAATGLAGIRLTVLPTSRMKEAGDRDVLLVQAGAEADSLAAWGQSLPAKLSAGQRSASVLGRIVDASTEWFTGAVDRVLPREGWAEYKARGPLGALIGFESPLSSKRSVIAINATEPAALAATVDAFIDPGKAVQVQGDLTLVRGDAIEAYRVGTTYNVGSLSWWRWLWYQFHTHPVLLGLIGLLMGVLIALVLYSALRRVAAQRLSTGR